MDIDVRTALKDRLRAGLKRGSNQLAFMTVVGAEELTISLGPGTIEQTTLMSGMLVSLACINCI